MRSGHLLGVLALLGIAGPTHAASGDLFAQRCAMCHQAGGQGLPGQFPRLAGRAASIAASQPGRRYLALVLLNGMIGTIQMDGQTISGLMPSLGALPDQSLADLLNHIVQLAPPAKGRKPAAFTAAEIAAVRKDGGMSGGAVAAERAKLAAAGLLP